MLIKVNKIMKIFGLKSIKPTRENNILQLLFKKLKILHYLNPSTHNQTIIVPYSNNNITIFQSPKANPKVSLFLLNDKTFRFFGIKKISLWATYYAN